MTLLYNAAVAVLELVYAFSIAFAMDALIRKRMVSQRTSRKIIHLWMGGLIAFWFIYAAPYAQLFFIITPVAWIAVMLYALGGGSRYHEIVKRFARENDIMEVMHGPLLLLLMLIIFTLAAFMTAGGVAALAALTFGDGVAPLVGKRAKRWYFRGRKSIEGSAAVFAASLFSMLVIFAAFLPASFARLIYVAAVASVAAAIIEALTPRDYDNLTVPVFVWLIFAML